MGIIKDSLPQAAEDSVPEGMKGFTVNRVRIRLDRFCLLSLLLSLVVPPASVPAAPSMEGSPGPGELYPLSEGAVRQIDRLLDGYGEAEIFSGEILIALGDRRVHHEQYGYRSWKERLPLTQNAIYKIGSLTKQFTAAAILRLEETGRIGTQDPLGDHVPELPGALLRSKGAPVTLHHLLTHTSGIPDVDYGNQLGRRELVFSHVLDALSTASLDHEPGAEYHYNSVGYVLLGEVIRRRSGLTYEAFLRREFFDPLGMKDTGIRLSAEQRKRFAPGQISTGVNVRASKALLGNMIAGECDWDLGASGSIFSTAADLDRWISALQKGEVLGEASLRKMVTPELHNYGYGWVVRLFKGSEEEPIVWHNGALSPLGYKADVGWLPRSGLRIILLANLDETSIATNAFENVERIIAGSRPFPPERGGRLFRGVAFVFWAKLHLLFAFANVVWYLAVKRYEAAATFYSSLAALLALVFFFVAYSIDRYAIGLIVITVLLAIHGVRRWRGLPLTNRSTLFHLGEELLAVAVSVFLVGFGLRMLL